jgi:endonuclease YncB( thermonuclease family)
MAKIMYEYKVSLVRVIDGDTFVGNIDLGFNTVLMNKHIRVAHINAPEKNTPEGKNATKYVTNMLTAENTAHVNYNPIISIRVLEHKTDKYGRILAEVEINSRRLDKAMVEDGHAVPYEGKN